MAWGDGILTVYDMIKETIILLRSVVKRLKYILGSLISMSTDACEMKSAVFSTGCGGLKGSTLYSGIVKVASTRSCSTYEPQGKKV
jgi:hypothetical protein